MTSSTLPDRPPDTTASAPCPRCGAATNGRFCSACGTPAGDARCHSCDTRLSAGARFCHRCGTPAGAPRLAARGGGAMVAWIVAGVSLAALVGVIAFSRRAPAPPAAAARDARDGAPATGGPPDLSQMTPRDAADRLFNRVMKLQDERKRDSVSFFAPMAMTAYEALAPLDADARFHLGAVGIATGDPTLARIARAQADTILAGRSTHLLGLVLGAQAAALLGDTKAARDFTARLLAAEARELAAPLDEYLQHRSVIDNALRMARTSK